MKSGLVRLQGIQNDRMQHYRDQKANEKTPPPHLRAQADTVTALTNRRTEKPDDDPKKGDPVKPASVPDGCKWIGGQLICTVEAQPATDDLVDASSPYNGGFPNRIAQLADCPILSVVAYEQLSTVNPQSKMLLQNTFGSSAQEVYSTGSAYFNAVILNTAAAAGSIKGMDFSSARIEAFYFSDKIGPATSNQFLPFGLYITGFKGVKAPKIGRSDRYFDEGSAELESDNEGTHFDTDLANPLGGGWNPLRRAELFFQHQVEFNFNEDHQRPTHPGDVAKQLQKRGVNSGVSCLTK